MSRQDYLKHFTAGYGSILSLGIGRAQSLKTLSKAPSQFADPSQGVFGRLRTVRDAMHGDVWAIGNDMRTSMQNSSGSISAMK